MEAMMTMEVSAHYARIRTFMQKAGQATRDQPTMPTEEERVLRAKLIMEEALETCEALGVKVVARAADESLDPAALYFCMSDKAPDLIKIADGCADLSVVTVGTLIACGIADTDLFQIVDEHNLAKFGPGGYRRDDGKWIKPPDLQPPDMLFQHELGTFLESSGEAAGKHIDASVVRTLRTSSTKVNCPRCDGSGITASENGPEADMIRCPLCRPGPTTEEMVADAAANDPESCEPDDDHRGLTS